MIYLDIYIYDLLLINDYWSSPSDQICSNLYSVLSISGVKC